MRRLLSVAALAATTGSLLFLGGCAQQPAPMCNMSGISAQRQLVQVPSIIPGGTSPLTEMPLNSASVTDYSVIDKIFVRQLTAQRTATGTVEVVSQVINCTDYPLNVEARTQFYNAAQVPSEPVSAWKRFNLSARTSNTYRESSIGTKTVDFYTVELRETK